MAKTYIPVLSYKNKTLNALSHAGACVACIALAVLGLANAFAQVIPANVAQVCMYVGLIGFLAGVACIGVVWVIAKIAARQAKGTAHKGA